MTTARKDNVGYKRPPKKYQFKKGKSGNPKGRPKKSRNFKKDIVDVLSETVVVREGEKSHQHSKLRAIAMRLSVMAMSGDKRAAEVLLGMGLKIADDVPEKTTDELTKEDAAILRRYVQRKMNSKRLKPKQ